MAQIKNQVLKADGGQENVELAEEFNKYVDIIKERTEVLQAQALAHTGSTCARPSLFPSSCPPPVPPRAAGSRAWSRVRSAAGSAGNCSAVQALPLRVAGPLVLATRGPCCRLQGRVPCVARRLWPRVERSHQQPVVGWGRWR